MSVAAGPFASDAGCQTTYAVLDLGPAASGSSLLAEAIARNSTYQLIGLDAPQPILRVGTAYFRGERVETIGTDLIFKAEEPPQRNEPLVVQSSSARRVTARNPAPASLAAPSHVNRKDAELVAVTTKKVMMQPVKLSYKEGAGDKSTQAPAKPASASRPAGPSNPSVFAQRTRIPQPGSRAASARSAQEDVEMHEADEEADTENGQSGEGSGMEEG